MKKVINEGRTKAYCCSIFCSKERELFYSCKQIIPSTLNIRYFVLNSLYNGFYYELKLKLERTSFGQFIIELKLNKIIFKEFT